VHGEVPYGPPKARCGRRVPALSVASLRPVRPGGDGARGGLDGPPLVLSARAGANLSPERELCGDLTVGKGVISRASVDRK